MWSSRAGYERGSVEVGRRRLFEASKSELCASAGGGKKRRTGVSERSRGWPALLERQRLHLWVCGCPFWCGVRRKVSTQKGGGGIARLVSRWGGAKRGAGAVFCYPGNRSRTPPPPHPSHSSLWKSPSKHTACFARRTPMRKAVQKSHVKSKRGQCPRMRRSASSETQD